MPVRDSVLEVVHGRHNELIDPTLHVWGWEIPVYLFLGGLAAGLLVLPALLELFRGERPLPASVRAMPWAALALISLGMGALFLDLEYPAHVLRFYLAFEPASPMSWGSWILLVVYPVGIWLGLGILTTSERERLRRVRWLPDRLLDGLWDRYDRFHRTVLWTSIAVGVALGTYTGLLLGTLTARPMWSTTLLGPLFLVSGLSTAAAFMLLFRMRGDVQHRLVRWDIALIGTEVVFLVLLLLTLMTGTQAAQQAGRELLGGSWTGVFWGLVIVAGLLVPLGMEIAEIRRRLRPTVVAPALILIGGLSLRWILLAAGQQSSFSALP